MDADLEILRDFVARSDAYTQSREAAVKSADRLQEAGYAGADDVVGVLWDLALPNTDDIVTLLNSDNDPMEFLYRKHILGYGDSLAAAAAKFTEWEGSREDLARGEALRAYAVGRTDLPEWANSPATLGEQCAVLRCRLTVAEQEGDVTEAREMARELRALVSAWSKDLRARTATPAQAELSLELSDLESYADAVGRILQPK